jgi:hypothetical protein
LLHHFEGTKCRWYRLQQFGAIDDAPKEAIADEIDILLALPALEGLTSSLPPSPAVKPVRGLLNPRFVRE